jgi:hypothetical protein
MKTFADVNAISIEAYHLVGIVKCYYGFVQQAYTIITIKLLDLSKDIALQMAFKAINNIAGPNGLVFTLLVYSAFFQINNTSSLLPLTT